MSPKEQSERIEELEGTVKDLQKVVYEMQTIIVNVVSSHADYQDALNLHKEYVKSKEVIVDSDVAKPDPEPNDFDDHTPDYDGEPELGSHDLSDDQQSLDSVYGEDDHGVERL